MLPIIKQISKYNFYTNNKVEYIVIHDTGNYKDTARNNAKYFSEKRNSSAHYFVDENEIIQIVEDFNGAWAVGDGKGKYGITNRNNISIEMCNSGGYIADKTIKNTLELTKFLMDKYNIKMDKVIRHYDASHKSCPNNMMANNWAKWHDFKKQLAELGKNNKNVGDDIDMIADTVKIFASQNSPIKEQMQEQIKALQGVVGLAKDGIATEELVKKLPELKGHETRGCVTIMQNILILKGMLSKGSATGIIGQANRNGINRFKESVGIPLDTPLVDRQTWRKLLEY